MKQYELVEFFGVLPKVNEEDCYESYRVKKSDITLELTLFYPRDVHVSIIKDGVGRPIFSAALEGNVKLERLTYKNDYDCLELKVPCLKSYGEEDWSCPFWIRIFIEPSISIAVLR